MIIGTRVKHRYTSHYGFITAYPGSVTRTVRWDGGGIGDFFIMDLVEVTQ